MVNLLGWLNWWSAPTYVSERSRELILVGRGTVSWWGLVAESVIIAKGSEANK